MSASAVVLPVLGGLLAAGLGSVATIRTARFNADKEHERWRRAELLNACVNFMSVCSSIAVIRLDPVSNQQTIIRQDMSVNEITAAYHRLQMIAPENMRGKVKECRGVALELYTMVSDHSGTVEQIMKAYVDNINGLGDLMILAQDVFK